MSKLLVCFALCLIVICCLSRTEAAPARELDWRTAIDYIIAAYEHKYPGPSKRYAPEYAHVINPKAFNP
ncbi:uncharacterized protein LOC118743939 [Rhagoletis pomonella]|uniref:uncharacterized protein LOC118743939 n=1 Tax=Rhagoletis pomonella TaxID=28610 RepID=UPI0017856A82|nr:uncharacterized protein LOC118743939 [Rhagoletis pomonella]